jgi:hypothetical protein
MPLQHGIERTVKRLSRGVRPHGGIDMDRNWHPRKYERLSDAVQKTGDERYQGGSVGIWYARTPVRVDLSAGLAVALKRGYDITRKTLSVTHVHLGDIEAEDAEMAFALMSGNYWSPHGEANDWLKSLDLDHTSMIVGDVVDFRGKLLFVEFEGFTEIVHALRNHNR